MKTPTKVVVIVAVTLLPVAVVVAYGLSQRQSTEVDGPGSGGQYTEIDWRLLRELNYETGAKPETLASLDGKYVKIPGFVVPLDDDAATFSEFLLVPSPQACVHVPPPPPNQMVMVRMKSGQAPQRSWGPVQTQRTFQRQIINSGFLCLSWRQYYTRRKIASRHTFYWCRSTANYKEAQRKIQSGG